nr:hypothetical protein CFP56_24558 [Quercus suber]
MSAAISSQLNKPLPPRPIAYIPKAAGPPNHGRSLMDGEESPLLISAADQPQDGSMLDPGPALDSISLENFARMPLSHSTSHTRKLASRIPSPQSRRATLVDVQSRRTNTAPIQITTETSDNNRVQMGRRLLEPGNRKTMRTNDTYHEIRETIANQSNPAETSFDRLSPFADPEYSHSNCTEAMVCRNSEDEEQITTPTSNTESFFGLSTGHRNLPLGNLTASKPSDILWAHEARLEIAEQTAVAEPVLATGLLGHRTPQSEARYKTAANSTQKPQAKIVRYSGSSGAPADSDGVESNPHISLLKILKEHEQGTPQLNPDHSSNSYVGGYLHQSTLCRLESQRSPHEINVDGEIVSRMFGHLTQDSDRFPKDASFLRSATAAEKFLSRCELQSSISTDTSTNAHLAEQPQDEIYMVSRPPTPESMSYLPSPAGPISRWSQSTESEKMALPPYPEGSHPLHSRFLLGDSQPDTSSNSASSGGQDSTILKIVDVNKASSNIPAHSADQFFKRKRGSVTTARASLAASAGPAQAQIHDSSFDIGRPPANAYTAPIVIAKDARSRLETWQHPLAELLIPGSEIPFQSGFRGGAMFSKLNSVFFSKRGKHADPISPVSTIHPRQTARAALLGSISHMHLQPPTAEVAATPVAHTGTAGTSPTRPLRRAAAMPLSLNPPSVRYDGMFKPNAVVVVETGVPSPSAGPVKHVVIDTAMTLRRALLEPADEHEDP